MLDSSHKLKEKCGAVQAELEIKKDSKELVLKEVFAHVRSATTVCRDNISGFLRHLQHHRNCSDRRAVGRAPNDARCFQDGQSFRARDVLHL